MLLRKLQSCNVYSNVGLSLMAHATSTHSQALMCDWKLLSRGAYYPTHDLLVTLIQ